MNLFAKSIAENPIILVIILVAAFGLIVLGVILVKKYVPAFKNTDTLKSEKEIAQEEVDRLVVDVEEGLKEKKKEEKKETKEQKPTEEEALKYEMDQLLEDAPEAKPQEEKKEDEKE